MLLGAAPSVSIFLVSTKLSVKYKSGQITILLLTPVY
jgi:hypothetical protein